jgi:LacI family transcriptional regulator
LKKNYMNSTEIAKLAGVSRSTISRVINNYPNVPQKTREKVMKIIEQYNYFPNISGQVLAGKKTRVIGLFGISRNHVSSDILTNLIIASVIYHASSKGYYVLTHIIHDTKDVESIKKIKELFYQRRIDGGIFINAANHEPMIEELIAEGFAIGIFDQNLPGRHEPNRVVFNCNDLTGAEQIIDYLAGLNHKKIGILNGDVNRHSGASRYQGFLNGMRKHGLPVNDSWVMSGEFNETSGYTAMNRLLAANRELPTAIFAMNDSIAFGAGKALIEHGLKIPEDISIVGFDDHMLSAHMNPPLTTYKVDFGKIMGGITTKLISIIEEGSNEFEQSVVESRLIERESCKRL